MYEFIREDIVIKLGARFGEGEGGGGGDGEGIDGGDAAGHGGSGALGGGGGVGVGVGERDGREGCKGGCNSGEKGFRSSVKEVRSFFFLFPSFLSVVARVFGAIRFPSEGSIRGDNVIAGCLIGMDYGRMSVDGLRLFRLCI